LISDLGAPDVLNWALDPGSGRPKSRQVCLSHFSDTDFSTKNRLPRKKILDP
jgi:hypothetical protein